MGDVAASISGVGGVVGGGLLGILPPFESMVSSIVLGAIGALTGFLVKRLLDRMTKRKHKKK